MTNRANGIVVVYYSRLGGRLSPHQKIVLADDARVIADLKGHEFVGDHDSVGDHPSPVYFVPDDTLLADEARSLGIQGPDDLYGGVVPYPFVKTKAISHRLIDDGATRPEGWSRDFPERVREVVFRGHTVFSAHDARIAAERMLARGAIRLKKPLGASGKGQTIVSNLEELETFLENFPPDEMETYGLVLEENLREVTTLSVGHISLGGLTIAYHGRQNKTTDNEGRSVYAGSDLTCVRGGWQALGAIATTPQLRAAIAHSRLYDSAMTEYTSFMASRRNYDVGVGIDADGDRRLGVFESSWRVGGATSAELVAMAAFTTDPLLQIADASHVEAFGNDHKVPREAVVHFQGDDPEAGPLIRYTVLTRKRHSA